MSSLRTTLTFAAAAAVLWAAAWRAPARPPRASERTGSPAAGTTRQAVTSPETVDGAVECESSRMRPMPLSTRPRLPEPLAAHPVDGRDRLSMGTPSASMVIQDALSRSRPTSALEGGHECTGEVLVGPASLPARQGGGGAQPDMSARGPLKELGVDGMRPDEALRRLLDEYRASFGSAEADADRAVLVDQGMAEIVRTHPETADALFTLFLQERHRGVGRYLAYLLRDARRSDQEAPLLLMATVDPDESRRANALAAIAPATGEVVLDVLLRALADPSPAVRLASAEAIESSFAVRPGLRLGEGVSGRIDAAVEGEIDAGVAGVLARIAARP